MTFTAMVTSPTAGFPTVGVVTFWDGPVNTGINLGSGAVNGSGVASVTTAALSAATHTINAVYTDVLPDTNFASSPTATLGGYTVAPAPTTITSFTTTGIPDILDQNYAATGSLLASFGGADPSIHRAQTFTAGATGLLSKVDVLVEQFQASPTGNLVLEIRPTVSGAPQPGASPVGVLTSASVPASIAPMGSPGFVSFTLPTLISVTAGQVYAITLHASGGTCQFNWVGDNTNSYAGGSSFTGSSSGASWVNDNPAWDLGIRTYVLGQPAYGQPVTFNATVTSSAGIPQAGKVTFWDGPVGTGFNLGSGNVSPGTGQASITTAALTAGTHTLNVVYTDTLPDTNYAASAPVSFSNYIVVAANTTITSLTSSALTAAQGQTVTFTANVATQSPSTATVNLGTVTFTENGNSMTGGTVAVNASGVATFATASLAIGTHTIRAIYNGGLPNFNPSSQFTMVPDEVILKPSNVVVSPTPTSIVFGQSINVPVTVTGSPGTPTGGVTITFGSASGPILGSGALTGGTVVGGITITGATPLSQGANTVFVNYGGDSGFAPSSTSFTLTMSQAGTTTSVSPVGPLTTELGQLVTYTATVTGSTAAAPSSTGTVTFKDGAASIGTGTFVSAVGNSVTYTFATSSLAVNTSPGHKISASYGGSTNFAASGASNTVTQFVNPAPTLGALGTTQWTINRPYSSVIAINNITSPFTSTPVVNPGSLPTGLTASLTGGGTTITISGTPTATGTFNFTLNATDTAGVTASAPYSIVINSAPTLGALSTTTGTYNTAFSATIAISGGTTPFSSGSLSVTNLPSGLSASLSGSNIAISGTPTATGTFNSINVSVTDAAGATATSVVPYTITIQAAGTSTLLTSTPLFWAVNQAVTYTATVSTASNGTPVGNVVFTIFDNTTSSTFQTSAALPVSATAPNTAQVTFTSNVFPGVVGHTYTVTANYTPTAGPGPTINFAGSSSAPQAQIVRNASTTSVVATPSSALLGSMVTLTASVNPPSGTGTTTSDTVTFLVNGQPIPLGANVPVNSVGVATLVTNALPTGSPDVITATYSGNINYNPSVGTTNVNVLSTPPGTVISMTLPVNSLSGQTVTIPVTVTAVSSSAGTPTGTVTFYYDGVAQGTNSLTNGMTSFSLSPLDGTHNVTMAYNGNSFFSPSIISQLYNVLSSGRRLGTPPIIPNPNLPVLVLPQGNAASFSYTQPFDLIPYLATDPNGNSLSFPPPTQPVTLAQLAHNVNLPTPLVNPDPLNSNNFYQNARGAQERYVKSTSGVWYFILPDGTFWQFGGTSTSISGSTQVARFDASYYANPRLLTDQLPVVPPGPPPNITVQVDTANNLVRLSNNEAPSFVGTVEFSFSVQSSVGTATQYVTVTFKDMAPTLTSPGPVSFANNVASLPAVQLQGATSDVGDTLSYNAQVFLNTPAAQAYSTVPPLGLTNPGSNYYFNTRKAGEKYLVGTGGIYYYILSNGQLFQFTGSGSALQGTLVASLDGTYWTDPNLLVNLQTPAPWTTNSAQAYNITQTLGLYTAGSFYFNIRGWDEKYVQGIGNQWYYILPGGQFYQYVGNTSPTAGRLLGTLDVTYWSDPSQLVNARNVGFTPFINSPITTSQNVGTLTFTNAIRSFLGTLLVKVTVADSISQTATTTFTVTVTNGNTAPSFTQPSDIAYHTASSTPSGGSLTASDSDALTYKIEGTYLGTPAALAYQLQQTLGLFDPSGGSFYFNTRKGGEKYLVGNGNQYYYLLNNGQLFQFAGTATVLQGILVATLDSTYWTDPNLLAHAVAPASWTANAQTAYNLTHVPTSLNLVAPTTYYPVSQYPTAANFFFNSAGFDEKYLNGTSANQFYFILPNGQFYLWGGSVYNSTLLATLDVTYWSDPNLLLAAQANGNPSNPVIPFVTVPVATAGNFTIQNITSAYNGKSFIVQASVDDGYANGKVRKFFRIDITA